jgi:gluconolactonase
MIHRSLSLFLVSSLATFAADPVPAFHGSIERLDPALDALIAPDAKIEVLASGFNWSEGPVWRDGGIVFSDVPENTVFGWKEGDTAAKVVLKPSGVSAIRPDKARTDWRWMRKAISCSASTVSAALRD